MKTIAPQYKRKTVSSKRDSRLPSFGTTMYDCLFGTVVAYATTVLEALGSIPGLDQSLYDLQIIAHLVTEFETRWYCVSNVQRIFFLLSILIQLIL